MKGINKPLISVITPVYQAENYLKRCVDSILCQTYTNFELILVDDGSLDKSGAICDVFAIQDSRVQVIHKLNCGVSAARQSGLDVAVGDFVIQADSDDWWAPNLLEELVLCEEQTHADLIIFDFYRVTNGNAVYFCQKPTSLDHKIVLKEVLTILYGSSWNKLVRKSVIDRFQIKFPVDINLGEDKCFLASLLINSIKITHLPKALYFYDVFINNESLVRKVTKSSMENGFRMVLFLENLLGLEYQDEIFIIKKRLKLRALKSGLYTKKSVKGLYSEINSKLLKSIIFSNDSVRDTLKLIWINLMYKNK